MVNVRLKNDWFAGGTRYRRAQHKWDFVVLPDEWAGKLPLGSVIVDDEGAEIKKLADPVETDAWADLEPDNGPGDLLPEPEPTDAERAQAAFKKRLKREKSESDPSSDAALYAAQSAAAQAPKPSRKGRKSKSKSNN